jgi:hypothetical protein
VRNQRSRLQSLRPVLRAAGWLGIMCAPKINSHRIWKCLFFTAESFALLGFLYAVTGIVTCRFYSKNHIPWAADHISVRFVSFCEQWMNPMLWSFTAALLILASQCELPRFPWQKHYFSCALNRVHRRCPSVVSLLLSVTFQFTFLPGRNRMGPDSTNERTYHPRHRRR